MPRQSLEEILKEWVAKDYFTPSIKAEVILDTLLTPYVPQILKSQYKDADAVFLAKEMSLIVTSEGEEQTGNRDSKKKQAGNRGPKIDYVLADKSGECVYLVELKTTDSSMDGAQLSFYDELAKRAPNFGDVLGRRLLTLLKNNFGIDLGAPESWADDGKFVEAWQKIWAKRTNYAPADRDPEACDSYTGMAMELIKAKNWAWKSKLRSRKYIYTLGQLMDFIDSDHQYIHEPEQLVEFMHSEHCERGLWNRRVELFYLIPRLPEDCARFGGKIRPVAFVPYFQTEQKNTPLAEIINDIYGGV